MEPITIERVIHAPRERVWQAWTDEKDVAQWWGPKFFSNPRCEWDARPGGKVRVDMQAPDGTIFPMAGEFKGIDPPNRIVLQTQALDKNGKSQMEMITTITLEPMGDETKLTMHGTFTMVSPEMEAAAKGGPDGWSQSFEKLEELVGKK